MYLIHNGLFHVNIGFLLGLFCFILGLCIKLGVAPFHSWVPDVYQGTPIIIVYFLNIVPKISIFCFLLNMFITLRDNAILDPYFNECLLVILIFCGLLSVFLGSVGALYQVNIKNLLALSAVANMGYLLVSLSSVLRILLNKISARCYFIAH